MNAFLVLLCCLAVASGFVLEGNEDENRWKAWKKFHGKTYASESEEATRRAIWNENNMLLPDFTVICEGEKGWVQCKQYELIKIIKAFWGRDDHVTCPKIPAELTSDLCETNAENTLAKINGQCKNKQACEVVASNIFFDDDSCGNVYKYLKIWYECIPDEANAVDVLKEGDKRRRRQTKKRATKDKRSSID
ncbi:hypothetical protein ACROYT_G013307 [Oculina patagonica]